jgi:gluconolactonase
MRTLAAVVATLFAASTSITAAAADLAVGKAEAFHQLVAADAKVEKLGTGMKFLEGPCWIKADGGWLVFSDIPSNELKKWTAAGGVTTWRMPSNNANGNLLDQQGRLISCEHSSRRVTRTNADGTIEVLVDSFDGKKLNSPNDVAVKSDGTLWITDPPYGIPKDQKQEQAAQNVFRFDPKSKTLTVAIADCDKPNGLCFSPDEKLLYVADSGKPKHIRVFTVKDDGTLGEGKVFATLDKGAPDGIRCDGQGNVWSSAGDGVRVYAPDGTWLGTVLTPEGAANLCFGGADGKTLFITARTSLYAIPTLTTQAVVK